MGPQYSVFPDVLSLKLKEGESSSPGQDSYGSLEAHQLVRESPVQRSLGHHLLVKAGVEWEKLSRGTVS